MGESNRRKKLDPNYGKSKPKDLGVFGVYSQTDGVRCPGEIYISACKRLKESIDLAIKDKKRVIVVYPDWKHEYFLDALATHKEKYPVVFDLFEGGHPGVKNSKTIVVSPEEFGFAKAIV